MSLAREVHRLAIPAIGTSLLQTAVFLIDRIMLGRHGAVDLAAIQIAANVEWSLFSLMSAFTVGTLARVGMARGAGDEETVRRAIAVSLLAALGLGLVLSGLLLPLLALLPKAFPAASAEALAGASGYLQATMLASPAMLLAATAMAAMQGSGDTRTPFAVGLVTVAAHIGLNRVFILGGLGVPAMGVRGAGISTALTFTLEALALLVLLLRPSSKATLRPLVWPKAAKAEALQIGRIAWPAALERSLLHTGFLLYTAIIGLLGDTAMAANQGLISVESICFTSAEGFGIAAASVVATKVGAGEPLEARDAAKLAMRSAVALLVAFAVAILAFREPLLRVFSQEAEVLSLSIAVVPVLAFAQPFMATGIVLSQSVRGAGATKIALMVSLAGSLLVRVPTTYLFAIHWEMGLWGAWVGSTLDWIVRALLLFGFLSLRGEQTLEAAALRFGLKGQAKAEAEAA